MQRCVTLLFLLIYLQISAQEDQTWYFGWDGQGIDWSGCEPQLIQGSMTGFEGVLTVSDSQGNLLFYSNSDFIWNANNQIMEGGEIAGFPFDPFFNFGALFTNTQLAVAQNPANPDLYYVFTGDTQNGGFFDFKYATVDMSLNNGLGAVTENVILPVNNPEERVCTIPKSDGTGMWVITHEYLNNRFLAFLVDENGVNIDPVISDVGEIHEVYPNNLNTRGEMRVNIAGNRIALVQDQMQGEVELFDFDQNTGELTNPLLIDQVDHGFGLCFSPDGNLLYLGTWVNFDQLDNYLYQYDLSSNDPDVIGAYRVTLETNSIFNPFGSMRVAPNGKLYVAYPGEYLGVINNPDTYGEDCDWEEEAFFLGEFSSHYGLNCLWETPPSPSSNSLLELGDNISSCTDVTIGSEVEGAIEYSWNTNSSEPFITINESGTYELTVSLENCDLVDQIEVEIGSLSIDLGENISLCEGESTTIGLEIADAAYSWNTSDDTPFIEVSTPGTYTLSVDQNDCQAEDSISVIIQPLPIFELPNTIEDCPEVSLSISPPDGSEVSWSNGIQGNNAIISESEEIAISAFLNGCQYTASVDVIVNDPVVPPAFSTLTCANESAEIFAPDGFVFSDQGTPSSTVLDLQPGIYDLEILDNCGAQTWTVNIEEEDCECDLFFPNVFTPNNDNKNEQFIPSEKCPEAVSYQIFNRWGQLVFDSEENSRGWDGNDQNTGEPLEDGVYFYKAKVNIANQPADFNGTITLLR